MMWTTRVNEWVKYNIAVMGVIYKVYEGGGSDGEEEKSAGAIEMEYRRYVASMVCNETLYGESGLLLGDSKGQKEPN
jgi:hypothetical protein